MNILQLERRSVGAIAAVTALTGALQMVAGAQLLAFISTSPSPAAAHNFATVGMFMLLFGCATLHAQRRTEALRVVLLWGSLQKLLAAVLVAWGVGRGVFLPLALAVVAFDFASSIFYWDLRRREGQCCG